MSARAWLAACALAGLFGVIIGWGARAHTTYDRYIISLAESQIAERRYYNKQLDITIQENKRRYGR